MSVYALATPWMRHSVSSAGEAVDRSSSGMIFDRNGNAPADRSFRAGRCKNEADAPRR
jgi:hypothetical protein